MGLKVWEGFEKTDDQEIPFLPTGSQEKSGADEGTARGAGVWNKEPVFPRTPADFRAVPIGLKKSLTLIDCDQREREGISLIEICEKVRYREEGLSSDPGC
jgi:hypothetical protein